MKVIGVLNDNWSDPDRFIIELNKNELRCITGLAPDVLKSLVKKDDMSRTLNICEEHMRLYNMRNQAAECLKLPSRLRSMAECFESLHAELERIHDLSIEDTKSPEVPAQ